MLEKEARLEFLFRDYLQADLLRVKLFAYFLHIGLASRLFAFMFIKLLDFVLLFGLVCVFIVAIMFLLLLIG